MNWKRFKKLSENYMDRNKIDFEDREIPQLITRTIRKTNMRINIRENLLTKTMKGITIDLER